MDTNFLIDTNILIYFLNGKIPEIQFNKVNEILKFSFNISTITKIELLGWNKITNENKIIIENFINKSVVIYIDKLIENKAIEIKQLYKIALPDAVIAATSLINNLSLVTRNESDFKIINGLNIYNPFN